MNSFVHQLCPNCGLCCNGVLFADVELRAGDDAKKLKKLGLEPHPKPKTKMAFAQPCACFPTASFAAFTATGPNAAGL